MPRAALLLLPLFAACAPIPDVARPAGSLAGPQGYPSLIPLAPVLERAASAPDDPVVVADRLNARAAALRSRGAAITSPGPTQSDADLRARAEILRGDATDIEVLRSELAAAGV